MKREDPPLAEVEVISNNQFYSPKNFNKMAEKEKVQQGQSGQGEQSGSRSGSKGGSKGGTQKQSPRTSRKSTEK